MLRKSFLLLTAISLVSGCSNFKKGVGLAGKTAPDEFRVVKNAPLELPPGFNTLPKPQPGIQRPQETTPKQDAQVVIFGAKENNANSQETENAVFLNLVGTQQSESDIRKTLDQEYEEGAGHQVPVIKKLTSMGDPEPISSIVDPELEKQRIEDNINNNRAITEGETPTKLR